MDLPDPKRRAERDETDASLLAERAQTDAELAKKRSSSEQVEDQVIDLARERARETLDVARELADRDMALAGMTSAVRGEVKAERDAADGAVAEQRDAADARLRLERIEHKQALAALLRLEREATDDGLLIERARADEVVATRDDFLGIVSHDMRNILGSIAMSASMLARQGIAAGERGPAMATHVERIQRGAARMNRLVGDLLDVVSLEAGRLHLTLLAHDAAQLVKEAAQTFEPSFAAKGITLATKTAVNAVIATFDHDRMLQVLANLLSNALKFTERGGRVDLSLDRTGPGLRFSVKDSGAGIPADQTDRIFERFGQVTRDPRGHGLGLYISKCIVEAHGGTIWAESSEGRGATLRFTLPA